MAVEEEVKKIVETLRSQVRSLQTSLKDIEDQVRKDAPRSHLFGGHMMTSLLSDNDPVWFTKYLHSMEGPLTTQHLLLGTLLCHQQRFKQLIVSSHELQGLFLRPIKSFDPDVSDIDQSIWFKSLIYNLIKSKQDKPRIVSPQFKSAGFTFAEQTKLEESLSHNPNVAAALGHGAAIEEWSTEVEDANVLLTIIVSDALIKRLVSVKAGEALACICRITEYRPAVIRNGGATCMLEFANHISNQPERREQILVAIARLSMTTDPRIWRYPQVIEVGKACFELISNAGYELYQFEAGIGLTNLLSFSEEVIANIGSREDSFIKFIDLVTGSRDERLQLVGTELVCNLCCSPEVVERIANGRYGEQLKILVFLIENGSDTIQSAASGALAILSSNECLIPIIEKITADGDMLVGKLHSENLSAEVELRIASIMSNIIEMDHSESIKQKMTDELRNLRKRTQEIPENERLISLIQSYC